MGRFSMALRPRYRDDEMDGEQLSRGIGGAIDELLVGQQQRRAERNTFADMGVAPEPQGPSPIRRAAGAVGRVFGRGKGPASVMVDETDDLSTHGAPRESIATAIDRTIAPTQPPGESYVYEGTGQRFRVPTAGARQQAAGRQAYNAKRGELELTDEFEKREADRRHQHAIELEKMKPQPAAPRNPVADHAANRLFDIQNPLPLRPRQQSTENPSLVRTRTEQLAGDAAYRFIAQAATMHPQLKGRDLVAKAAEMAGPEIGKNGVSSAHLFEAADRYKNRLTSRSPNYEDDDEGGTGKPAITQAQYDRAIQAGKKDAEIAERYAIPLTIKRKR